MCGCGFETMDCNLKASYLSLICRLWTVHKIIGVAWCDDLESAYIQHI